MTPALSGALVTFVLDSIAMTALLVSPLGAELLSLIFDQPNHRRQPMTADPQPTHVREETTCPMCGTIVARHVLPYGPGGSVLASPEIQERTRVVIAEHEKTCPGNR